MGQHLEKHAGEELVKAIEACVGLFRVGLTPAPGTGPAPRQMWTGPSAGPSSLRRDLRSTPEKE